MVEFVHTKENMLESQEFKIKGIKARNVRIVVKGHLKGCEEDITQELHINIPAAEPNNDQAALTLWQEIARIGGLTVKTNEETYEFYSMSLFSSLTAEFQLIEKISQIII
jgi:hypothetical protein